MGSFNQKIWIILPTVLICFYVNLISARYVYSPQNTIYKPYQHYNLLPPLPKNMQLRRFMWSNENAIGDFYKDVSSGAHAMRQMVMGSIIQPSMMKFRNYFQHASPSNNIKYVVRKPKKIVHVKKVVPKKIIKIVTIPTSQSQPQSQQQLQPQSQPQPQPPIKPHPTKPTEYSYHSDSDKNKYINPEHDHVHVPPKDTLRMIEEEEERRVEATISALFPVHNYGTSDYNIITGKIEEFDDSWRPIRIDGENILQPQKAHPVSPLHINVDDYTKLKKPKVNENLSYDVTDDYVHLKHNKKPEKKYEKKIDKIPYEVTEVSAEESIQFPQALKPKKYDTNKFTKENVMISSRISSTSSTPSATGASRHKNNIISTSTTSTPISSEKINYPDYYLEAFPKEYQVDCATKTPLIWKNTSKKDSSSTTQKNPNNPRNASKHKKERQTNIQSVTTEKPVKLKPMRKYSSKIKKKSFRTTLKPAIKIDDLIESQPEIHRFVTLKDDINELQAIPTAFTTRIPDDYVKYVTTTAATGTTPSTTISTSITKFDKFDKERIKKLRGAKKYGE